MCSRENNSNTDSRRANVVPFSNEAGRDSGQGVPERALPVIQTDAQIREVADEAWQILLAVNGPPGIFRRNNALIRLVQNETGPPTLEPVTRDALFTLLVNGADWLFGKRNSRPPECLLRHMLAEPHPGFLELDAVITTPVLGRSGRLIAVPEYYPEDKILLCPSQDLDLQPARARPSAKDIEAARSLILDEALGDFPFQADADRAHVLSALLLPFVKPILGEANTPLHVISAPVPGSGKTLLVHVLSLITIGRLCAPTTVSPSESEFRKKLGAMLIRGEPIIFLDNLSQERALKSETLATMLTSPTWTDRLLGHSKMISAPNNALWLLTGNNPQLSMELARRSVHVRLLPRTDRPWLRSSFRHPDLLGWVQERRSDLVHACLTLVQAWVAAKSPGYQGSPLGSFATWSRVLGGILDVAKVTGFLGNLDELYSAADDESDQWRVLVKAWWEQFQSTPVRVTDLLPLCCEHDILADLLGQGSERSQSSRLGRELNRKRDCVFEMFQVCKHTHGRRNSGRYLLKAVGEYHR
jgi:hypothetical protein